jgi:hypothetical protein
MTTHDARTRDLGVVRTGRRLLPTALLAIGVSTAMACAPRTGSRLANSAAIPSSTGSRVITREQITAMNVFDAYAVLERVGGYRLADNDRGDVAIRQRRGQTSLTSSSADRPVLIIDGAQVSDFGMLRRIRSTEIERVELVSPGDAAQRYGTNSSGAGAIIIVTRSHS